MRSCGRTEQAGQVEQSRHPGDDGDDMQALQPENTRPAWSRSRSPDAGDHRLDMGESGCPFLDAVARRLKNVRNVPAFPAKDGVDPLLQRPGPPADRAPVDPGGALGSRAPPAARPRASAMIGRQSMPTGVGEAHFREDGGDARRLRTKTINLGVRPLGLNPLHDPLQAGRARRASDVSRLQGSCPML